MLLINVLLEIELHTDNVQKMDLVSASDLKRGLLWSIDDRPCFGRPHFFLKNCLSLSNANQNSDSVVLS